MPLFSSTGMIIAPEAWVIGVSARKRTSPGQSQSAISVRIIVTCTRWVCITPLGWPVVPPV